jgi:3-hydroxyisobutyrate dehydrogenase
MGDMADTILSVAVLGLGIMGRGMAENLIAKGLKVAVYNRNPVRAEPFQGRARIAATSAEAARDADIIVAMVTDDEASRGVWLGAGGALAAAKPGAVLVDSSTLSLAWGLELAGAAKRAGLGFIDAPVTGSKQQAADGVLRFLVGGDAADIDKARPALDAMGGEVVVMGPVGSGIVIKLINNFIAGVGVAAFAEGLAVAEKSGLDVAKAREMLLSGASASPLIKTVAARIVANDFSPNFFTALLAKDLDYMMRQGASVGLTLDSAAAARRRYLDAVEAGLGEEDITAVIKPLRGY